MNDLPLHAISPIDGRYRQSVAPLSSYFSEFALMRHRLLVEVEYFIALANHPRIAFLRPLTESEVSALQALYRDFDTASAERIKAIEDVTRHDTKAVEYFLREYFDGSTLDGMQEGIHFGLTSEDVSNLAYALCVQDGLHDVILPALEAVQHALCDMANEYADLPMLARTHGQPASPTTVGKEFAVFAMRLNKQREALAGHIAALPGKLNGATGNFNALMAAYPDVNWIAFSRDFISALGLQPNLHTTQIEPQDELVAVFDAIRRADRILLDFCQDMWRYISDGYFAQRVVKGEVGSSTMPHKVNPIQFENAEGNLEVADALLTLFARRLPVSRLQRDLSNSTVLRNIGVALAHALLAYQNIQRGLARVSPDRAAISEDLSSHWEVLTEAIQTILRRENLSDAYDLLKDFSRGATIQQADIEAFVDALDVSPQVKAEIVRLTPQGYTGLASTLAAGHEDA